MRAHIIKSLFWFLIAAGAFYVGWSLNDTVPPYEWDKYETTIIPDPVEDGGRVSVNWKIKVNRICPGTSERILTDANQRRKNDQGSPIDYSGPVIQRYDITPAATLIRPDDDRIPRTFVLPRGMPSMVGYSSNVCFQCNFFQRFVPVCVRTPELIIRVKPPVSVPLGVDH